MSSELVRQMVESREPNLVQANRALRERLETFIAFPSDHNQTLFETSLKSYRSTWMADAHRKLMDGPIGHAYQKRPGE